MTPGRAADSDDWFPVLAQAGSTLISARDELHYAEVQSRAYCLVISGRGRIVVNGAGFEVGPRSLIAMPWRHRVEYQAEPADPLLVNTAHLIPRHDPSAPLVLGVAHGPADQLWNCPDRQDSPVLPPAPFHINQRDWAALTLLICYTAQWWKRGATPEMARHLGAVLFDETVNVRLRSAPQDDPNLPPRLRRAMAWAVGHLYRSFQLADLSAAAGVSPTTIGRLFRLHVGEPPMTWVQNLRLQRAAQRLRESMLSVGQIARQVGYDDAEYFARMFRRRYGMTPTQWRQRWVDIP